MNMNGVNIKGLAQREGYHHGNLRAALLEAALAVLLESGPDALSLRGVAKRAGVSSSAPFLFSSPYFSIMSAVVQLIAFWNCP